MREHEVNKLDNFICGWYMEDTQLIDDIVNYGKTEAPLDFGTMVDYEDVPIVVPEEKDSMDCQLNICNPALYNRYLIELQKVLEEYMKKYPYSNMYAPFTIRTHTNFQYYPPSGGFHAWHTERASGSSSTNDRHLVFMTYLNDVTDGGETEFYHQKLKIKPERGLTLIWGADWTFTHRGIASPTQEKMIITGWYNYT